MRKIQLGLNFMDAQIEDNSVDCVIAVPPMSRRLDWVFNSEGEKTQVNSKLRVIKDEVWLKCLDKMKPGAYAFIFTTRRYMHRWACQIEDLGFEMRDTAIWMYKNKSVPGVGSNKSNTPRFSLRPLWDPILIMRKPYEFTNFKENWKKWKVGRLNFDEIRMQKSFEVKESGKVLYKQPPNLVRSHIWRDEFDMHVYYSGKMDDTKQPRLKTYEKIKNYNRKPKAVIDYFVKVGSIAGQTILDPFAGYGICQEVCKESGRNYLGYEINYNCSIVYDKKGIEYEVWN